MVVGGCWWFLMVLCVFVVAFDVFKLFLVVHGGFGGSGLVLGSSRWLLGVLGDFCWFLVVHSGS